VSPLAGQQGLPNKPASICSYYLLAVRVVLVDLSWTDVKPCAPMQMGGFGRVSAAVPLVHAERRAVPAALPAAGSRTSGSVPLHVPAEASRCDSRREPTAMVQPQLWSILAQPSAGYLCLDQGSCTAVRFCCDGCYVCTCVSSAYNAAGL